MKLFLWTRKRKIDAVIDLELFSRITALLTGFRKPMSLSSQERKKHMIILSFYRLPVRCKQKRGSKKHLTVCPGNRPLFQLNCFLILFFSTLPVNKLLPYLYVIPLSGYPLGLPAKNLRPFRNDNPESLESYERPALLKKPFLQFRP